MKKLISVIVPVYNVEYYLDKCISSICKQTYTNLEIILVDDGSTDSSSVLCDKWEHKDNRIKVIHKENGGLSSARNAGIEIAKGEYVGFVDSDDFVDSNMYKCLLNNAIDNNADISICSYTFVNDDGSVISKEYSKSPIVSGNYSNLQALSMLSKKNWQFYVTAVNKLYKRELFESIRFPEGRLNEDQFVVHQLFYKSSLITMTSDSLYYYVQRHNSIMRSKITFNRLDDVYALRERLDFYWNNNLSDYYYDTACLTVQQYMLIRFFILPQNQCEKEALKEMDGYVSSLIKNNHIKINIKQRVKMLFPSFMTRVILFKTRYKESRNGI